MREIAKSAASCYMLLDGLRNSLTGMELRELETAMNHLELMGDRLIELDASVSATTIMQPTCPVLRQYGHHRMSETCKGCKR